MRENGGACSESKQRRKRKQREKNESERVYRKEDKIEERAVIGINKEIDGTSILRVALLFFQGNFREIF